MHLVQHCILEGSIAQRCLLAVVQLERGENGKYCRSHHVPCRWPLELTVRAIPGNGNNMQERQLIQ